MIKDYDRRFWFGASEGNYIFGQKSGAAYRDWWRVKCGVEEPKFHGNIYTRAGNTFEHSILRTWEPGVRFDRQILIPSLRFRANLDGNTEDEILEVKTYQIDKGFKVTEGYYYQAQLQILAWNMEEILPFSDCKGKPVLKKKNPPLKRHIILAYGLYADEYYHEYTQEQIEEGSIEIDPKRILVFETKPSRGTQRAAKKNLRKMAKQLRKEEVR